MPDWSIKIVPSTTGQAGVLADFVPDVVKPKPGCFQVSRAISSAGTIRRGGALAWPLKNQTAAPVIPLPPGSPVLVSAASSLRRRRTTTTLPPRPARPSGTAAACIRQSARASSSSRSGSRPKGGRLRRRDRRSRGARVRHARSLRAEPLPAVHSSEDAMSTVRATPIDRPQFGAAFRRCLADVPVAAAALIALMPLAQAQGVVCPPISQPLVKIPGSSRRTACCAGPSCCRRQLRMLFRIPQLKAARWARRAGAIDQCLGQTVRASVGSTPSAGAARPLADPRLPGPGAGPTLRRASATSSS